MNGVSVALDETAREVSERQVLPAGGLRERIEQQRPDNGPTLTVLLLKACNRPIWLIEHRFGRAPSFMAVATNFGIGAHKRRNPSTVGKWLALWPEFSAEARMPPTARRAPRGGRHGSLDSDCGAGAGFLSALSHRSGGFVPT